TFPLLAFIWIKKLIQNNDDFKEKFKFFGSYITNVTKKQMFLISSGILVFILILFMAAPGTFFDFSAKREADQLDVNKNIEALQRQVAQNPQILEEQFNNDEA